MNLSEEQKAAVSGWIENGESLASVQSLLESEFGLRITYMDLRFIVDDLQLELKSPEPAIEHPVPGPVETEPATGGVTVTLDKITRPDALVSGQVTFSDGVSASWLLDQMGRLSLNPSQSGYRPNDEDLRDFQDELRKAVEKSGML